MQMTVTVDDPTIYMKPFALSKNEYRWIPDQEEEEQICVPSEMLHYMDLVSKLFPTATRRSLSRKSLSAAESSLSLRASVNSVVTLLAKCTAYAPIGREVLVAP